MATQKSDKEKSMEPTYYVGLVVFDKAKRRILLGKRKEDGVWTGPGGSAGMDESPKQAIIREAYEEANLHLKPYQLKELPTLMSKDGKMCHCFYTFVDKGAVKLHTTNDPDSEIRKWEWHRITDPLPGKIDEDRLNTINAAKMKVLGLRKAEEDDLIDLLNKAIVSNPEAGIDINTAEESQNELAAEDNPWLERIETLMLDSHFGELPRELELPNFRKLLISKIDDGIYSGFVQNVDSEDGEYGENLTQLEKMTPVSMVQALKAKGYLPRETPIAAKAEEEKKEEEKQELISILDNFKPNELHIHLHGDEKEALRAKLAQFLGQ